jgi:tetratricopeptide (TPR) repeat protein
VTVDDLRRPTNEVILDVEGPAVAGKARRRSRVILHQRGKHAEAMQQIDFALKKNRNHAFALNNRGVALGELKHFEGALARFDRAIARQPDYVDALSSIAATSTLPISQDNARMVLNRSRP